MHANRQMKQNVSALLKGRHLTQKDLAMWCRKSESWASKILDLNSTREFPLKYWDRIADFFGVATYQLLQPGISAVTERRRTQRRSAQERRVSRRPESERPTSGFTDQALIREVLSVPFDERPFLFESIAVLKRRRVESPIRGPLGAAHHVGEVSKPPVPRASKPRKSDVGGEQL
jgi:hypothetical protein